MAIKQCVICGGDFEARTCGKYCSPKCSKENHLERTRKSGRKRRAASPITTIKQCMICEEKFEISRFIKTVGRGNHAKTCSPECVEEKNIRYRRNKWATSHPKLSSRKCIVCDYEFAPKNSQERCCSTECKRVRKLANHKIWHRLNYRSADSKKCVICKREFGPNRGASTCSIECRHEKNRRKGTEHSRKRSAALQTLKQLGVEL